MTIGYRVENSLHLQYLPEIPGYVPVYIRYGDQPLEDINPDLAGAFHETSGIFNRIREITLDGPPLNEISNKVLSDKSVISLHSKEEITPHKTSKLRSNHFISFAPREISNLLQKSISLE
ncbi:PREDICTED: uncharacterized protein LOC105367433 isoform X2 [Ceratosolen solmsi marchali]|uniref:Uncharacterized protein LOC105367433 isoform X2 n=1 Tax=Ceratosolen solmsi marchali TaxID=326594 RepID=A0AAJ6YU69_9HYME|nr:PREDICTED: uncharacterized protein LOC105367433 isoform X2 [Ceratosolen solmsi marchali]